MAQQHINIGTPNGENGDFVRDAFSYTEDNFTELYARIYKTGNALLTGGVVHLQNLDYYVWASAYIINDIFYNELVAGVVTLSDGDYLDPRFDLWTVNSTTYAKGTVTLNTGAAGSVDSITVDGVELLSAPVTYLTSLPVTANRIVNEINSNTTSPNYFAKNTGAVISIYAADGGVGSNGFVVDSTATTITTTDVNMADGSDSHSVGSVTGEPDVDPVKPDINLDFQVEISFKLLQSGIVGDPDTTTVTIYDENLGTPGEWNNATLPVGANLTHPTNPFRNTVCIDIPSTINVVNKFMRFNAGTTLPNDNTPGNNIIFAMKTTAAWTVGGANPSILKVKIGTGGSTSTIAFTAGSIVSYGFQHTQTNIWQLVIIPIANYSDHFPTISFIEFEFDDLPNLQMDWIIGQVGIQIPTTTTTSYLGLTDTIDTDYIGKNGYVPAVTGQNGLTLTPINELTQPIEAIYSNLTTLVAGQVNQTLEYIQEVTDGSTFPGITTGKLWVKYLGTSNGNATDYQIISKEEDIAGMAPIPLVYADDTALFADQGNQLTDYIYEITDGSGFTGVFGGRLFVKYKGTVAGNETDYTIISIASLQGLQEVLTVGDYAESPDTFSWFKVENTLNGGVGIFQSFISDDGTTNVSNILQEVNRIELISQLGTLNTSIGVADGEMFLYQVDSTGLSSTYIDCIEPTANTILRFPAKTAGTYTIAVVEDMLTPPFEAINEGSGIGYIIRGSNRAQAGTVGFGAFDFGYYYVDATQGATGTYSISLGGEDNQASDYGAVCIGGYGNVANDPYTYAFGFRNITSDYGGFAIGNNLRANDANTVVVGQSNVDNVAVPGINGVTQRRFVVGNGNVAAGSPPTSSTRSDAFVVYHGGQLTAPSMSIAEIAAYATGDILVTREYLAQEVAKAEIGFAASDETTDLAVGTAQLTMRMPFAMTLTDIIISVNDGPFGSTLICDIKENGVSVLSTLVSIDAETRATGTVTLTGGASGSVDGITVNGVQIMSAPVAYITSLSATATAVAANITAFTSTPNYTAAAVGAVITITSVTPGSGPNGYLVTPTTTTITTSDTDMVGGLTEETSDTAAVPVVISDASLAMNSEISVDITQVGSIVAGTGLKVWLIGSKA